jgi:Cu+-exporting ATPase
MLVENLYFESSAMIIYFIKLGRFIESNSMEKTKEAIKELVQITPQSALIKIEDDEKEVTIDEVKKGDILICKPGMKVAVDGIIVKGSSHFEESFITGESKPSKKGKGEKVIAGSINLDGYIEYTAEKIGPDSTISEMVRLVVEAANSKAPIQRIADKVSGIFVPSIILIAIVTLILYLIIGQNINESLIAFVTVLVVACPCALGLATPLALVVSIGTASRNGILIKKSETLENIKKIDMILFDKTGTLTNGKLSISKIYNYSNYDDKKLLKLISSIERKSSHPIAIAFKDYYDPKIIINNFDNIPGIGVSAEVDKIKMYIGNNKLIKKMNIKNKYEKVEKELSKSGNSILYIIENNKIIALIGVKDILRDNAKYTIKYLLNIGKEIVMLSGDNKETANNIAKELGIRNVIADVLPSEKEKILKKYKDAGYKTMMIGDGINDAPSIVSSDVGVSLSGGTDIAVDSADVVIIQDDLSKIIKLFMISKKTIRIIKQNLFFAFIYNIIMIPMAIGIFKPCGITISPMIASIFMTLSSLSVVFNSLRLRTFKNY